MRGISEDHHANAGGKNWRARVRIDGKEQTLGRWHTQEEAESFLTDYWAKVMPDTVPWLFTSYPERVSWYTTEVAQTLRALYPQANLPLPAQKATTTAEPALIPTQVRPQSEDLHAPMARTAA